MEKEYHKSTLSLKVLKSTTTVNITTSYRNQSMVFVPFQSIYNVLFSSLKK